MSHGTKIHQQQKYPEAIVSYDGKINVLTGSVQQH